MYHARIQAPNLRFRYEAVVALYIYSNDDTFSSSSGDTVLYQDFNNLTAKISNDDAFDALNKTSFIKEYPYYLLARSLLYGVHLSAIPMPDFQWWLERKEKFYRGGNFPSVDLIKGNYICFNHWLSVSASEDEAKKFVVKSLEKEAPTLFTIRVHYWGPRGFYQDERGNYKEVDMSNPVNIEKYSKFPYEREFLFHPGANFKITSLESKPFTHTVPVCWGLFSRKCETSVQHVELKYYSPKPPHQDIYF